MAGVEYVHFRVWHIPAIGFRFGWVERQIVFTPDHQKPRLLVAHPGLPLGIRFDVSAVIVKQVALNIRLAGLVQEIELVLPKVRIIALDIGIASYVPCARSRKGQRSEEHTS